MNVTNLKLHKMNDCQNNPNYKLMKLQLSLGGKTQKPVKHVDAIVRINYQRFTKIGGHKNSSDIPKTYLFLIRDQQLAKIAANSGESHAAASAGGYGDGS
jgi:hypothetical protein